MMRAHGPSDRAYLPGQSYLSLKQETARLAQEMILQRDNLAGKIDNEVRAE